ncbi:Major facilitator superfamily domain [Arabidopsis suecica]|uniref:Major facilitator superfamily domain n=1 Tax=Arabidopsis suecica TaxID=45249 RepID=A0A8T2DBQ9_ARASU|nr:Major facilitator superfamily domain [Arabidopsis suecica]
MALDPEQQQPISSVSREFGKSSGEISPEREPLIKENHVPENYSVVAAILPFLFPALGGLLYGYEIGATSCATISLQSPSLSGISWYNLSSVDVGLVTSGSLYGALFGSIVAFTIADVIGRRKELILAALLYLVGALVTALAPTYSVLIIGRVIYGVSVGLAMHAAPMYIAETAPSPIRGQLVSLKEFFIVLGMVGGYGIGSLTVNVHSGWRYMYATSVPLAVLMGIGMWWLPASPRWLLLRVIQGKGNVENQREAAIKSLCRLRGPAFVDSAAEQVNEILAELTFVGEDKEVTFGELFQGKCLKALTIGGGLVLFQQITGQPSVLYYAPSILQTAGFSAAGDATRVSILLGLLKLIMTGVAVVVIDRLGRRPLLLGGVGGMVVSLFLLGSYYLFFSASPVVAVVALLLYVGCYQLSFGPIGWLMISEIFPLKLRGRGLSLAVLVNFGANALVTFAFSPLKELLGAGILFCGFGVICVLSLVFIFFIVPETKGLTLEEIEAKCL